MTTRFKFTYVDAQKRLAKRKGKVTKLENNTYLEAREHLAIAVKLHDTDVVLLHADGRVTLNSGGWLTKTTQDRIEKYGIPHDWTIYTRRGQWLILRDHARIYNDPNAKQLIRETEIIYQDGMTIDVDGEVKGAAKKQDDKKRADLEKLISTYVTDYMTKFWGNTLPQPGNGDPWTFAMVDQEGKLPMLGSEVDARGHLYTMMRQKYHFGSLLVRAFEAMAGIKHGDWDGLKAAIENGTTGHCGWISMARMWTNCLAMWLMKKPFDQNYTYCYNRDPLSTMLENYLRRFFSLAPRRTRVRPLSRP
jgi:hypothetical protein